MIDFNKDYRMTINGALVSSTSSFPAYNPATKAVIAQVPNATQEQLDEAVSATRQAQIKWRDTPLAQRQEAVDCLGQAMEKHAEEFMSLLTREQGKARAGAEWEIGGSIYWFREIAKQSLEEEIIVDDALRYVYTRRTPVGVVGAITPWNFPVLLAVWKIAPALVAGCTVICKPASTTPLCTLKLGELCRDILPPGVLNIVTGEQGWGNKMTKHPGIDKIAFTGSTEVGKIIMEASASTIKRMTLELGGNDPAIVLPDVDIDEVVPQLFWAAFTNTAQFCNATKRLYVHESIYDKLLDRLVAYTETVKVGDGAQADTQLGPIQNLPQYNKVVEFYDDCVKNGYKFAVGGKIDRNAPGWFLPVTLVDNPPEDSRIVVEEPFGPILPVLKWRDEADVIARANNTRFGLGASVWGKDLNAVQRIGRQLEVGTVWLNEIHQYAPNQAFGGHKESGLGCENSLDGLAEYTNWQTITLNKS